MKYYDKERLINIKKKLNRKIKNNKMYTNAMNRIIKSLLPPFPENNFFNAITLSLGIFYKILNDKEFIANFQSKLNTTEFYNTTAFCFTFGSYMIEVYCTKDIYGTTTVKIRVVVGIKNSSGRTTYSVVINFLTILMKNKIH